MIDSHCHLHYDPYDEDRDLMIARAIKSGVTEFILPGTDAKTHNDLIELAKRYPGVCHATIGVHPTIINDCPNYETEIAQVERLLEEKPVKFVAIGEIGLDYYWSKDFCTQQKEAFIRQLDLAKQYNLPVIIHTRNAWSDTLDVMENYRDLKGVFHCFSGTEDDWKRIKTMDNMYVGLNATVRYKNYVSLNILPEIPLDRILLETDAPYLSPAPYRGKRNEPAYIPLFVPVIAQIYNTTCDNIDKITTFNTVQLFNL